MTELLVGTKKGLFVLEGEPGAAETAVGPEDRVDVLPAISGGAR